MIAFVPAVMLAGDLIDAKLYGTADNAVAWWHVRQGMSLHLVFCFTAFYNLGKAAMTTSYHYGWQRSWQIAYCCLRETALDPFQKNIQIEKA